MRKRKTNKRNKKQKNRTKTMSAKSDSKTMNKKQLQTSAMIRMNAKNRSNSMRKQRKKKQKILRNKRQKVKKKMSDTKSMNKKQQSRVFKGDHCQWLDLGTARSREADCADGTKMVIKSV